MKILIPGGAGYIGSWIVPHLLAEGHHVTVLDTMYFGDGALPDNGHLSVLRSDVRDQDKFAEACEGQDVIIYLAGITNNTMCERAPELAQSINIDAIGPCILKSRLAGIKRFIYASSVAVYGSSEEDAKEDAPLEPTTLYANGKKAAEEILLSHQSKDFSVTIVRCASVCGYSTHQRLDTTINMMAHHAHRSRLIKVAGGAQKRSHISIKDITRLYKRLLDMPSDKTAGIFNAVSENQRVKETAMLVARVMGHTAIEVGPRTDDRTYSVDGTKAMRLLDFDPAHAIESAIRDLKIRFESGYWPDSLANPRYLNLMEVA